ncbi:MAG: WecB/TagA/CpsF family glycosyltransferase [Chloroflexota bacterium]|nr:WecB/TagA/CpsF family glycosyltransferase [Chloroflexota bacterium]
MSAPEGVASILHDAAASRFPSSSLNGLFTFAPASMSALVDVAGEGPGILVAVNAEKIARADPVAVEIARTHLAYPDGIGAVLALRRHGIAAHRLPGAELWLALIERYAGTRSFYLLGATEAVVQTVADKLTKLHPGIQLWYRSGYVSHAEEAQLEEEIRLRHPDFVFVAMGSPRQELLMQRLYAIQPAVYLGLGGSFDVLAGIKRRAPRWLQQRGLEWAYRFAREPARLRRLPTYLRFVALLGSGRF